MPADFGDRRLTWLLVGLSLSSFALGVTATLWLVGPKTVIAEIASPGASPTIGHHSAGAGAASANVRPTTVGVSGSAADPGSAGPSAPASAAPNPIAPSAPVSAAPVPAAPVPSAEPASPTAPRSASASDGFRLQFGGFLDPGQAQAVAALLKDHGFQPTVVARKDGDGRDWQLVQVGRFSDAGSATLASSEMARVAGLYPVIVDAGAATVRP